MQPADDPHSCKAVDVKVVLGDKACRSMCFDVSISALGAHHPCCTFSAEAEPCRDVHCQLLCSILAPEAMLVDAACPERCAWLSRMSTVSSWVQLVNCGLCDETIAALEKRNIRSLFPIQKHVFEPAQQGRDLIGRARTGSGKTLAFALPVIENLLQVRDLGNLLLPPTSLICFLKCIAPGA